MNALETCYVLGEVLAVISPFKETYTHISRMYIEEKLVAIQIIWKKEERLHLTWRNLETYIRCNIREACWIKMYASAMQMPLLMLNVDRFVMFSCLNFGRKSKSALSCSRVEIENCLSHRYAASINHCQNYSCCWRFWQKQRFLDADYVTWKIVVKLLRGFYLLANWTQFILLCTVDAGARFNVKHKSRSFNRNHFRGRHPHKSTVCILWRNLKDTFSAWCFSQLQTRKCLLKSFYMRKKYECIKVTAF